MILLPINIILNNKPNTLFPSIIEDFTGVTSKTLKNIISRKNKPRKSTIDKISSNMETSVNKIPGCKFNRSNFIKLLELCTESSENKDINPLHFKIIEDVYTKYFQSVFYDILDKDIKIDNFIKCKYPQVNNIKTILNFKPLIDYILNCGLPDYMLTNITLEYYKNDLPLISFAKSIILLAFDVIFYLASAYEVEYNNNFLLELKNGDKPIMTKFLPFLKDNNIANPMALWFDNIMANCAIKSINEFALMFSKISCNTDNDIDYNNDSKLRQMRRWRKGEMFPNLKNIDNIIEKLLREKMQLTNNEDIEYVKENARFCYAYIKIFQKFLNTLKTELNLNNDKIESFFNRYYYWHNYHSVKFYEAKQKIKFT